MAEPEYRTISLTDSVPVRIRTADWPVIASADWHDGREVRCQADRTASIHVRQHADGRAVVYGVARSQRSGERDIRAGELVTGVRGIITAIHHVAERIGHGPSMAYDCIQELPAIDA